jgi:hypothetical protein
MSKLFSSVTAITSCTDKYKFPDRTSDSNRGVFDNTAGAMIRRWMWNGLRSGPMIRGCFGSCIDTSGVCAKHVKPTHRTEKTLRK